MKVNAAGGCQRPGNPIQKDLRDTDAFQISIRRQKEKHGTGQKKKQTAPKREAFPPPFAWRLGGLRLLGRVFCRGRGLLHGRRESIMMRGAVEMRGVVEKRSRSSGGNIPAAVMTALLPEKGHHSERSTVLRKSLTPFSRMIFSAVSQSSHSRTMAAVLSGRRNP